MGIYVEGISQSDLSWRDLLDERESVVDNEDFSYSWISKISV